MLRNRLALLALLIGALGACGGRSGLHATFDGSATSDGRLVTDVRTDAGEDAIASDSVQGDGRSDTAPGDVSTPDRTPDSPRPDGATDGPAGDARDGSIADGLAGDGRRDATTDVAPTLSSIEVTPPSPTIVVGIAYTGLVVTAVMSDGTTSDVTAAATFASSDATIVNVSGHTLTGIKAGAVAITATYLGKTAYSKLTVSASPLQSISIDGVSPVSVGQSILLTATGIFADGTKQDITAQATWASGDTTVATVVLDSASSKEKVGGMKAGIVSITATLSGIVGKVAITVTAAAMTSIDVTPAQPILQRGVSQTFQATATYADGTTGDVTFQASWTSSNPAVATVAASSAQVLVRALAGGSTNITATVGTVSGSTTVTVTTPTLVSISVTPATWTPNVGGTQNFTATGTYSDKSTADVTSSATWSSTDTTTVSISNAAGTNGQATALALGGAQIQASLSGVSGTAQVKVSSSPLVSIKLTPDPLALVLGLTGSMVATGNYQNGTTQDLTSQVAWTVSDPSIATVSNASGSAGHVTGVALGSTVIVATYAGLGAKAVVNVSQATLTAITVTPASATISAGSTQQFVATGTYDNGATPDITSQVTWTSSNTAVAQVSNATASKGLATSLVAGGSAITATLGTISGSAKLTVTAPQLSSIMISPSSATVDVKGTQVFTVTAVYQNGTTGPVTGTWSSSNTSVATVQAGGGPGGRVTATGVAAGTSTITVSFQGMTDSAVLTVTAAPTVVGLTITPAAPPSILVGATQQFTANAVYSDGSTAAVTNTASWTSSNASVASVSNGGAGRPGGARGLATGVGAGSATITATYSGFTATATVTVRAAAPTALLVTPTSASVTVNGTQQFTAELVLEDGTTQGVTNTASWTTSNAVVASISNGGGGPFGGGGRGLATGLAGGTATITATSGGFTATATLTVSAATPSKLIVTPPSPSLQVGQTQGFVATLVYSDNTTSVVTGQSTWSSSDAAIATITTAGGGPGPGPGGGGTATAIAKGTATITATYGGLTATATLTVTDPPLAYVQVTPTNPNIPVQASAQFTATAVFTDNTTRNVTAQATWSSSKTSVAVVGNSGGTIGRATALAEGASTITATYQGMSGTSLLTVAGSVQSITVTPASPTTVLGIPVPFVATAILSNNATLVVTGNASWVSSDATVATVTAGGVATPEKAGSATITATYLGKSGTSTLTVSAATLSSIAVTPTPVSLAAGASQQLVATGTYSDATTRDITTATTWLSSAPAIATVSNAANSRGLLTALASGSANVTATFQGITSPADAITVP